MNATVATDPSASRSPVAMRPAEQSREPSGADGPSPGRVDVAVVGSGVVGLAVALGCAQRGLEVALIGRAAAPHTPSAAAPFDARIYALAPASVDLLEALRVWPQVDRARVQDVMRMRICGDDGAMLHFDAYQAAVPRLAVIVEESALGQVLMSACRFAPGIRFMDTQVEGYEATASRARLRLADNSALDAHLVVGADGARSVMRAAAGISFDAHDYKHTAVVANFGCSSPHGGRALQWFTADEGIVALLPLPGNAVSLVWSAPTALAESLLRLSPEALAQRVALRSGHAVGDLTPLGSAAAYRLRMIKVASVVAARLALVGDAAHAVHPLAGQGLNLGLQDVSELLAVVGDREAWRDPGDLRVLRRYARARAEPLALMRLATHGLAQLFGRDEPPIKSLRNVGMRMVDAIGPLKGALIRHAVGRQ